MIKSAFQDIFADELKKIKDESVNDYNENLPSVPEAADVLWEYEGIHDAYEGDGEEILLEMQRIFYEDLNVDLRQKGELSDAVLFSEVHYLKVCIFCGFLPRTKWFVILRGNCVFW